MSELKGNCPTCDADVKLENNVEESEIMTCSDCHTRIVVEKINGNQVTLKEAPEVEEDWGE